MNHHSELTRFLKLAVSFIAYLSLLLGCDDEKVDQTTDPDINNPTETDSDTVPRSQAPLDRSLVQNIHCGQLHGKLNQCSLLTEGVFSCLEPYTNAQFCHFDCLFQTDCETLSNYACGYFTGSSLETCIDACYGVESFICLDHSASIFTEWRCDGMDDCADGSDETDCTDFICHTSQIPIPEARVCDYYYDCQDGSDELNCPGFKCGSSEMIAEEWVCDNEQDCRDGSDEQNCPVFVCTGGETIPQTWTCDYFIDCPDASDEDGCEGGVYCNSGERIPESWICDLQEDCPDASDEIGCEVFVCTDGAIIPKSYECDLVADCTDGSDEHPECASVICTS